MEVERYILERDVVDGKEIVSLARIVMYDDKGRLGEEYFDGKWHPFPGALTYMFDPWPGEFIEEKQASEIIKQIDEDGCDS